MGGGEGWGGELGWPEGRGRGVGERVTLLGRPEGRGRG